MSGVESIFANDRSESAGLLFERVIGKDVMRVDPIESINKFPKAEILVGCYPCQGYSQGGRRDPSDGINYLYREFDRALRQIRPIAFIVENVSGMQRGENLRLLNNQLVRFRSAGYRVSSKVLDAADFGLPQRRKRLFIVGVRSSLNRRFDFPEPTHGPDRCQPHVTIRDAIWHLRSEAPDGSFNSEPFHWYYLSRNRRHEWDDLAPCVVANWRHTALHPDSPPLVKVAPDRWQFEHDGFARRFTYLECAALQGFPEPHRFDRCKVEQRVTAIGNAVPPPLFAAVAGQLVRTIEGEA